MSHFCFLTVKLKRWKLLPWQMRARWEQEPSFFLFPEVGWLPWRKVLVRLMTCRLQHSNLYPSVRHQPPLPQALPLAPMKTYFPVRIWKILKLSTDYPTPTPKPTPSLPPPAPKRDFQVRIRKAWKVFITTTPTPLAPPLPPPLLLPLLPLAPHAQIWAALIRNFHSESGKFELR